MAGGGKRLGSGKKNKGLSELLQIRVTTEEKEWIKQQDMSLMVRYWIRKNAGLCLHPVLTEDEHGLKYCIDCKLYSPDNFGKLFKPSIEPLPKSAILWTEKDGYIL